MSGSPLPWKIVSNFTYWEDVLIYCCGRNIKTFDFNVLLTLIYTCRLNRQFGVDGQKY